MEENGGMRPAEEKLGGEIGSSEKFSRLSVGKSLRRRYCQPVQSLNGLGSMLLNFFPILKWLPAYSWRENFASDVNSGLTTGVMFVPQGIAYAYLAGVDPVYGLYSSFFAPFFYLIFGTSPHVSRGGLEGGILRIYGFFKIRKNSKNLQI